MLKFTADSDYLLMLEVARLHARNDQSLQQPLVYTIHYLALDTTPSIHCSLFIHLVSPLSYNRMMHRRVYDCRLSSIYRHLPIISPYIAPLNLDCSRYFLPFI